MTDIHHRIGVLSPSTDGVYAALTTIEGLAAWWTTTRPGIPPSAGRSPSGSFRAGSTWR